MAEIGPNTDQEIPSTAVDSLSVLDLESQAELDDRTLGIYSEEESQRVFGNPGGLGGTSAFAEIQRREEYLSSVLPSANKLQSYRSFRKQTRGDLPQKEDDEDSDDADETSEVSFSPSKASVQTYRDDNGSLRSISRVTEVKGPNAALEKHLVDRLLQDPNQLYLHATLSSVYVPPRSDEPAIRLLGAWNTVKAVHGAVPKVDKNQLFTHVCWPAHKFRLLVSEVSRVTDSAYVANKVHAILGKYFETRAHSTADFIRRTSVPNEVPPVVLPSSASDGNPSPRNDYTGSPPPEQPNSEVPEASGKTWLNSDKVKTLRENAAHASRKMFVSAKVPVPDRCKVRNQRYAVVIFVNDLVVPEGEVPEPLFMFLRAFASSAQASAYVEYVAQPAYKDFYIDIVDLYEWLFPLSVDRDALREEYSNPELQKMIQATKVTNNVVHSFERFVEQKRAQQKQTVDVGV